MFRFKRPHDCVHRSPGNYDDHDWSAAVFLPADKRGEIGAGAVFSIYADRAVGDGARIQFIRADYHQSIFSNRWLLAAIASSLLLQALVLYTPLNVFFGVEPPDLLDWAWIGVAFMAFILLSMAMRIGFRRFFGASMVSFDAKSEP